MADINIGDIGDTPGLLYILQKFISEDTLILWKKRNGSEVKKMLNKSSQSNNSLWRSE